MRGEPRHHYSAQKAEVEAELAAALAGSGIDAYVFRPCIVAGPAATMLIDQIPLLALGRRIPARCAGRWARVPRRGRYCPTPACPSSSSTTTTSPRRSARR